MIIYVHAVFHPDGTVLREEVSVDPAHQLDLGNDPIGSTVSVAEYEINNHEVLKALWNPATMQERQAIVDALPRIQVISVAGIIQ